MIRSPWAVVALVATGIVGVVVLAVTHSVSGDILTWISAAIVPTSATLLMGGQLGGQVTEVRGLVNGNLSKLIDAALSSAKSAAAAASSSTSTPPASSPTSTGSTTRAEDLAEIARQLAYHQQVAATTAAAVDQVPVDPVPAQAQP